MLPQGCACRNKNLGGLSHWCSSGLLTRPKKPLVLSSQKPNRKKIKLRLVNALNNNLVNVILGKISKENTCFGRIARLPTYLLALVGCSNMQCLTVCYAGIVFKNEVLEGILIRITHAIPTNRWALLIRSKLCFRYPCLIRIFRTKLLRFAYWEWFIPLPLLIFWSWMNPFL